MGRPRKESVALTATPSYTCIKCGKTVKSLRNLVSSQSSIYDGTSSKIPICKDCIEDLYDKYVEEYIRHYPKEEVEKQAIKRLCMMFDIYFDERIFAAALKADAKNSLVLGYIKNSNLLQYKGKTYDDTLEREREEAQVIITAPEQAKHIPNITEKTIKFFGAGFAPQDYEFLQEEYNDWVTRHECNTKAQEIVFKRICFKLLEIHKASLKGKETKELDKSLQELLSAGKLQPKQNTSDAMSESHTFGTLIDKWEETRPLPEIDEELKDVDKIGQYIDVFFRGHLAKMMGIKNGLSNLYNKFIRKFTVEKPEYNEDENSEVLFDAIFGGQDVSDE